MKTTRTILAGLLAIAAVLFVSCDKNLVSITRGLDDRLDENSLASPSIVTLRSPKGSDAVINVLITKGAGFTAERIYATSNRPADFTQTIMLEADAALVDSYGETSGIEYKALPEAFYQFSDNRIINIDAGESISSSALLKIFATNPIGNQLEAGRYLLPITATASSQKISSKILYYDIVVREPFSGDADLYVGDDAFFVFYINTSQYDPRLTTDYYMAKVLRRNTLERVWYNSVGNIINLRTTAIDYDETTGRAKFNLSSDIRYVLDNYSTYIFPLQETGRKVCLSIEGANTGLGFCNMTDAQIEDFVEQVKVIFDTYPLDGINLWDRNSGYDKSIGNGLPEMNTTSYPKLIRALRKMLGPDRLLTLTDYEEPTEYFWDTDATGGIEVGQHIDYAWSGYNTYSEGFQIVDPYHQDAEMVSKLHPRKPIPALAPSRYGCINAPWGTAILNDVGISEDNIYMWVEQGFRQNKICVYEDLRTNLQEKFEGAWSPSELTMLINSDEKEYIYQFDNVRLSAFINGSNYGKWLKDW